MSYCIIRGAYATWWRLIRNIASVVHWLNGLHHIRVVCIVYAGNKHTFNELHYTSFVGS